MHAQRTRRRTDHAALVLWGLLIRLPDFLDLGLRSAACPPHVSRQTRRQGRRCGALMTAVDATLVASG